MKINNKKGITIIELIVTIALISIIMLFLYALLSNITFESDNEYIDIVDRTVREDMIRTINDTINDYNKEKESDDAKLQDYELVSGNKKVNIKDKSNVVYSISVDSEKQATLRKGTSGDVIQTWILDTGKFDTIACRKDGEVGENKLLLITCDIKVYTANINNKVITKGSQKIDNNNILDDITFTYGVYQDGNVEISSYNKITFNNNGGIGDTAQTVLHNTAPIAVTKPTKNGATFGGYFTSLTPTTLAGSVNNFGDGAATVRVETISNKQAGQWSGNKSDAGRFFQASLILTDNSLASAPNNVQFNDHVLNDNQYKITKLENHKWQYDIAFNITEDMVTTTTYAYETDYRFIDIEGTKSSTTLSVNYIYLDGGMIFDSEGQPLVQSITKDMTVIAKWITEYQELDSITTIKGKHTYIDTKFADPHGFSAEYVAQWLDNNGGYIVGSHSQYTPYVRAGGHWVQARGFEFGYGDTAYNIPTPKGLDVLHTKFKVEFRTTYSEAYFRVQNLNSGTYVVNKTYSGKNISSAHVYLYYSDWNKSTGMASTYAKVEYVTIWDSTGKKVRDYVPVKNTGSNEIGFYDKVEGKFYQAEGNGGFTAGNPTGNMID